MKKLSRNLTVVIIALVMTLGAGLLLVAGSASAAATDAKEAIQFNAGASMADNLAAFKGRNITVMLASGQTITGVVADVKGNLLHLSKLSQKEFYDALVAVDRITAIEVKVR